MDYTELLFAAAVRDLAAGMKTTAGANYYLSLSDDDLRKEKKARWDEEHPVVEFVPAALARLKAVAAIIKEQG